MNKKLIYPVTFFLASCCGSLYASDAAHTKQIVSADASEPAKVQPRQFSGVDVTHTIRPADSVTRPKTLSSATLRQEVVLNDVNQLIASIKKASLDIRREVKRLNAEKNVRLEDAEIKYALQVANRLDRYAGLLETKKKLLKDNNKQNDRSLKESVKELSQMDMMQLQQKMQKHAQLIQIMSNMQKKMQETSKSIISNMK